jgi:uncharacterized protein YaaW (UPF0174 family)
MTDIFAPLSSDDYVFLVGLIESPVNLTDNLGLRAALERYEQDPSDAARADLDRILEREIRYAGSADVAYFARQAMGKEPGVPFREMIRDVAQAVKVEPPALGTEREMLEDVVERYATDQFARLPAEEQQKILVELGVKRDEAARFLLKSAGVFSIPVLIQVFDVVVVQGIVKGMVFSAITRLMGSRLSQHLLTTIAGRLPWWLPWIGPAAWTLSIGWTALDIQGPALRKTVPIVLFLGLCALRDSHEAGAGPS